MRSLLLILFLSNLAFGQRIVLQDEGLNKKWQASTQSNLPRKFYFAPNGNNSVGRYLPVEKEIGPPNIVRTNAGMEFPWRNPGGRGDEGRGLSAKTVWPPNLLTVGSRRVNVSLPKPVSRTRRGNGQYSYRFGKELRPAWQWNVGSTFFELHQHPRGHFFELRCLIKIKEGYGFENYEVRVFRPDVPTELRKGGISRTEVVRSTHPLNRFEAKAEVVYYKDPSGVDWKKITEQPWVDDTGHDWHHAGLGDGWLTPKNYFGFITGSTHESCSQCHRSAGLNNDNFEFIRDWYGCVPGADGIFSAYPIQ